MRTIIAEAVRWTAPGNSGRTKRGRCAGAQGCGFPGLRGETRGTHIVVSRPQLATAHFCEGVKKRRAWVDKVIVSIYRKIYLG